MRTKTPHYALALVLSTLAASCLFEGCSGSQATAICGTTATCEGWSDNEEEACVAQIQGSEMESSEVGCSSEASDYEGCIESVGTCIQSVFVADGCDVQLNALQTCLAISHCTIALYTVHCS